jgi:hypothetical protein
MWENTVRVARAAYPEKEEEDDEDEDDMSYYSSYDDQEDFGADMGISCSDPIEYYD